MILKNALNLAKIHERLSVTKKEDWLLKTLGLPKTIKSIPELTFFIEVDHANGNYTYTTTHATNLSGAVIKLLTTREKIGTKRGSITTKRPNNINSFKLLNQPRE